MVRGVKRMETPSKGDRVLIVEGCTHHRLDDDMGKVKIPRWINQIVGEDLDYEWTSGAYYPTNKPLNFFPFFPIYPNNKEIAAIMQNNFCLPALFQGILLG